MSAASPQAGGREANYIFGYGSILSSESRGSSGATGAVATAELLPSFGWRRAWNFRKDTGFTALGLERASGRAVCGVIFPADDSMSVFDAREVGYRRVRVPAEGLALRTWPDAALPSGLQPQGEVAALQRLLDAGGAVVWTYVPEESCTSEADSDHPICQTYVDAVLGGCLECGGEVMATELILSTTGWSEYFLNDVPMGRRPWLHRRPDYATIDRLLEEHGGVTQFNMRRHPEEFGTQVSMATRGMWNVPRRNKLFVGREHELERLYTNLHAEGAELTSGVAALGTVGLGGVGKTQIAIEYCYRQYQNNLYGLVCWLNAESVESLAADFRKLASDFQVEVGDKKNEEVVEEIKSCFYRARCTWLLVFDNVESPGVVSTYLPRGGTGKFGHVLITSRRLTDEWRGRSIILDCFNADESAAFLKRAVIPADSDADASVNGVDDADVHELAERLGYLPLALAMAAAYMQRCDVTFKEYIARYDNRRQMLGKDSLGGEYPLTVAGSLSLSLERMEKESAAARHVLDSLCFMAPDGISKALMQLLLQSTLAEAKRLAHARAVEKPDVAARADKPRPEPTKCAPPLLCVQVAGVSSAFGVAVIVMGIARARNLRRSWMWVVISSLCAGLGVGFMQARRNGKRQLGDSATKLSTSEEEDDALVADANLHAEQVELQGSSLERSVSNVDLDTSSDRHAHLEDETDRIWALMKSYSLFVVREGAASMHRLLQQVLRSRQSALDCDISLSRCVWALQELWCFEPADISTWQEAGGWIEHIKTIGRFCAEYKVARAECSDLLTEGAKYTSMALSGFDEAQRLLELALQMQEGVHGKEPHEATARTMYELGKVLRYCGNLDLAEDMLQQALEMQRKIWASGECLEIAMTLHEMGVMHFKKQNLEQAGDFLQYSLNLKRRLPLNDTSTRERQRREEAVTLHHLAQVATASKPPRLDEAETLLQTALRLEGKAAYSRAGARGSTLQQLGRVSIRRGELDQARRYLLQALQLHESAYGSQQHVNVASDHHQLGLVEMNRRCYEEAAEHMLSALRIRRNIYVRGEHVDVAVDLTQLGKIERARGDAEAAQRYLEEAYELLRILPEEQGHRALKESARVLEVLRNVARDRGDKDGARRYLREQQQLAQQYGVLSAGVPAPREGAMSEREVEVPPSPLLSALLHGRESVRTEIVGASKRKCAIDVSVIEAARQTVANAVVLQQRTAAADDKTTDSGGDGSPKVQETAAAATAAAELFVSRLGEWRGTQTEGDEPKTPRTERTLLFGACDDLRQELQQLNVTVEDR